MAKTMSIRLVRLKRLASPLKRLPVGPTPVSLATVCPLRFVTKVAGGLFVRKKLSLWRNSISYTRFPQKARFPRTDSTTCKGRCGCTRFASGTIFTSKKPGNRYRPRRKTTEPCEARLSTPHFRVTLRYRLSKANATTAPRVNPSNKTDFLSLTRIGNCFFDPPGRGMTQSAQPWRGSLHSFSGRGLGRA